MRSFLKSALALNSRTLLFLLLLLCFLGFLIQFLNVALH